MTKTLPVFALLALLSGAAVADVVTTDSDVLVNGESVALDADLAASVATLQAAIDANAALVASLEAQVAELSAELATRPPASCMKYDPAVGIIVNSTCGGFRVAPQACFDDPSTCLP